MLADALVQYLAWKRWDRLVLVTGRHESDTLYAEALLRSVDRFGVKIVERKDWTAVPGARRTDSGHHSLQQEVPVFSRFKNHDVVLVADENEEFGEYFPYRMTEPRPVAGTQGLIASAWHRTQEQWGATQIQRRFEKLANRQMTPRDYAAWAAMRSVAEAVTQTSSAETEIVREYLLSDDFNLAGFKGVPLTFRKWNGQLRQPVLIVAPRMLVSVSPQEGFIHPVSELDTLGVDEPESACSRFNG
jgi:ABC transporter substrate binding protein (PQQ-dependent alcohol dehydrogenase system)